ncbi:hypothetical protein CC1G_13692 [Coprinopsis cinerea okayama7|uniref:Uncharacterized protein n=1 Tax=Coprinopsis cinerea (strain Okayama-7 / 130 / ATCC MYA-4618 / FGSC 9003) TaxID=240176 RepID=D6RJY7_COPC7|nr:hypothetical protein CC1G_13692 [Coprinopsis cinerea okayama7\|eukprot:XP_002912160.1 hypothetical protein CC1G_13692 [Coprinopsis cinerea okayama7\
MAPVIPSSLSPHVCILPSPDLSELLEESGLPPLPNILQAFSPLPQVTTRTASLVPVPHSSFALRFSDLAEVEEACREPEEQRAIRTLDWISARITKRCEKWVQDVEERGEKEVGKDGRVRSPWWDELRRCAEGDIVPDKNEGWNHPVSVILAVSTTAPNPLQAITALHARQPQLPSWVDPTHLRYTVIVHPKNSPLSDEEANALFNAVKKQFGLHTYLLPLNLPSPPPPPVPVPALMPRLPPPPGPESPYISRHTGAIPPTPATANAPSIPGNPYALNTLRLEEKDIQAVLRFTREFVVMSLIPWMERCVVEWNEAYSSTRRLPSRLFSSTRRLFGSSPSPSPGPGHTSSSSVSSLPGRSGSISSANGIPTPLSQPRRLAEFCTILGDFKLAINLWESLRKESKGGSDIIPILSAPSPALQLHASNALVGIHPSIDDLPPHAQLRALLYAKANDGLFGPLGILKAEEAPSALLLAHAALLSSVRKRAFRRAGFWYTLAANRLEKCGIKPLTVYFFRKAHELYQIRPPKELSPSFWDSEGKSPTSSVEQFVDIRAGVEHPLARLLYTTGNITGAVQMFLGALRVLKSPALQTIGQLEGATEEANRSSHDRTFLDDFRVAFAHLASTEPEALKTLNLSLPLKFCQSRQSKIRFSDDSISSHPVIWEKRENQWQSFWKSKGGKERLASGRQVCAGDTFWVDLAVQNPLDADVELNNLTLILETNGPSEGPIESTVEVERVSDIVLGAKESRTIPIALKALKSGKFLISKVQYDFLGILSSTESLASRGRRLNDTLAQRQTPTYAPDVYLKVDVSPADNKLSVTFVDDGDLILKQGEIEEMKILLTNTGTKPINEVWLVLGGEEAVCIGEENERLISSSTSEIIRSKNTLGLPEPQRVPLDVPLESGSYKELSVCLHADRTGSHELLFLILYRENDSSPFHSDRLSRTFEVQPILDIAVSTTPSLSRDCPFILTVEATSSSLSSTVSITQISAISPLWKFHTVEAAQSSVSPSQKAKVVLSAEQWLDGEGKKESIDFLTQKLGDVLSGNPISSSEPPELDLFCSHIIQEPSQRYSIHTSDLWCLIEAERRQHVAEIERQQHPHIPEDSHPNIFPLYSPTSVDLAIFWEMPAQKRKGHVMVFGINLGATHGALNEIIANAENAKVKRSMYAETVREKAELLEGIRTSQWNVDVDPTVATVEGNEISHDFGKGPCHVPVSIVLRNHSPLYDARVTLKLRPGSQPTAPDLTPAHNTAPYSGRLTFRNELPPGESATVQPRLFVDRPGLYSIGPFAVDTELVIPDSKCKRSYSQQVSPSHVCIVVRQSS